MCHLLSTCPKLKLKQAFVLRTPRRKVPPRLQLFLTPPEVQWRRSHYRLRDQNQPQNASILPMTLKATKQDKSGRNGTKNFHVRWTYTTE